MDGRSAHAQQKKLKESIEICDVVHNWNESSPKDPPTSGANYISTGFGSVSATFWIQRGGSAADAMGCPPGGASRSSQGRRQLRRAQVPCLGLGSVWRGFSCTARPASAALSYSE